MRIDLLYIEHHEGYASDVANWVVKLREAVYQTKQGVNAWYTTFGGSYDVYQVPPVSCAPEALSAEYRNGRLCVHMWTTPQWLAIQCL
jgi:hypothetical protein